MAATVATVLALAVAIESTAVLPAAVAAGLPVAVAAATVMSIFQVAASSSGPLALLAVVLSFQIVVALESLPRRPVIGRQAGPGGRAFVRAPAGGRGSGLRVSAQLQAGRRCMDPPAQCAMAALSLGCGARMQRASGCDGCGRPGDAWMRTYPRIQMQY